ncbi:MAG TPA: fibronectin type III domain-containing protein [Terriglobia bacterium]|nr:fibronectin type III domain-containing protein [Terriglobia bacterium]
MSKKNSTLRRFSSLFAIVLVAVALVVPQSVMAGSLLLSWGAIPDSRLAGYKIKYGTASGSYTQSVDVGNKTSHTLQSLTEGTRYYVVIVGYDSNRVEGAASVEVSGSVLGASSISSSSLTTNSAVVTWQTNKPADTQVEYGTTTAYGSVTTLNGALVTSHSQALTNLQPATTYQFRVRSKDEGGSSLVSANFSFTTTSAADTTPPGDVTQFTAIPGNSRAALSWTNPTDADFKGVMLRYRTDGVYPTSKTDGILAADRLSVAGAKDYFDHLNLTNGVTYYYSGFTYDTNQNYSSTAHTQATPVNLAITSISPTRGTAGTTVVILGMGFGATQGSSRVTFNDKVAPISAWSSTSITAVVPDKAGSGLIVVTVNGAQTNGVYFRMDKLGKPGRPRLYP